ATAGQPTRRALPSILHPTHCANLMRDLQQPDFGISTRCIRECLQAISLLCSLPCCSFLQPPSRANDNLISGPLPTTLTTMTTLSYLELQNNNLSGPLPSNLGSINTLKTLNLRDNLLTGKVLEPVPANVWMYKLDNNYLSQGFSSPPPCGQGYITYHSNCAGDPAPGLFCGPDESQKAEPVCAAFCGVSSTSPACNGHGTCYLDGPNNVPTCLCDDNFVIGKFPGSCVPVAGESLTV
ncbi:unnamed protein product, partial [Closterium sp. NIES-64]